MPLTALERRLLAGLLRENPFQPATSWWRAIELAVVIEHGFPQGLGLDLGCGDGKLMSVLLEACGMSRRLAGVDIDPLETRDAAASGVYERVHMAPGDRVPEPDAAFDFVFSNSVLEHIDDIEAVVREVARLLRPQGTLLVTVPGPGFHACLRGPLLPWAKRATYLQEVDRRCAHKRYWSAEQWRDCLQGHGIELVRAVPYLTAAQTRRWETLTRFTSGLLYSAFGARLQPIDIQRRLHLRKPGLRLPRTAAAALAAAFATGTQAEEPGKSACLLLEGRRRLQG